MSLANQRTEPVVLRTKAAAEALGVSPPTLEHWRVAGSGPPFVRLGSRAIGYLKDDLLAWAAARRTMSTSAAAEG